MSQYLINALTLQLQLVTAFAEVRKSQIPKYVLMY